MYRKLLVLAAALFTLLPAHAHEHNQITRGIPRGADRAELIESLYDSPFGEVQFTRIGRSEHSGFLRNARGYLIGFLEVRGPAFCGQWFQSEKTEALPSGCEFVFMDDTTGRMVAVRSDEMTETSLFQATRGKMRDLGRSL